VRWGWDPNDVALKERLLRLVWSEWTHQLGETKTEAKAVEVFLREQAIHETLPPSPEAEALSREAELAEEERSEKAIERLRAALVEASDTVNLLWLDFTLQGPEESVSTVVPSEVWTKLVTMLLEPGNVRLLTLQR
jgi:hypothetical protein